MSKVPAPAQRSKLKKFLPIAKQRESLILLSVRAARTLLRGLVAGARMSMKQVSMLAASVDGRGALELMRTGIARYAPF